MSDLERMLADRENEIRELSIALARTMLIVSEACEHWNAEREMRVGRLLNALCGREPGYRSDIDAIRAVVDRRP